MKAEKAKEVYEKLLANPVINPTLVYLINKYYACKLAEKSISNWSSLGIVFYKKLLWFVSELPES